MCTEVAEAIENAVAIGGKVRVTGGNDATTDGAELVRNAGVGAMGLGVAIDDVALARDATNTPSGTVFALAELGAELVVPSTNRAMALFTPKRIRSRNTSGVKSQVRRKRGQLHNKRS